PSRSYSTRRARPTRRWRPRSTRWRSFPTASGSRRWPSTSSDSSGRWRRSAARRRAGARLLRRRSSGLGQARDLAGGGLLLEDALLRRLVDHLHRLGEELGDLALAGVDLGAHALDQRADLGEVHQVTLTTTNALPISFLGGGNVCHFAGLLSGKRRGLLP